jgi:predicted metal-dependent hydrolase
MSAFEYQLSRSIRRKTLSIVIRRGQVKVMAPVFLSKRTIADFIETKTEWVLKKLQSQQSWVEQSEQSQKQFVDGERFLYLGIDYPLQISNASKSEISLYDNRFFVTVSNRVKADNHSAHVKKMMQDWYKQQLIDYLVHRVEHFAQLIDVTPTDVNVRSYKRRWGSCSSKGLLSFNYLLIMAPNRVIDYVIVHELCHLIHLNHSAHFWAEVNRYYPQHKAATQWLKVEGGSLRLD